MRWTSLILAGLLVAVFTAANMVGTGAMAAGPLGEIEPNDTCATAQDLGLVSDQLSLQGSLDGLGDGAYPYPAPGMAPNIDFFQIGVTPGSVIEIRVSGLSSGLGTLADPLLGILSAADDGCNRLETIDYGGLGLDARIQYAVNSSSLVLAVTSCCDYSFVNGGVGAGSYTLDVEVLQEARAIIGTVIDGQTGLPPVDNGFGFVGSAELYRCVDGNCQFTASAAIDPLGRFSFINSDPYPAPGTEPEPPFGDSPFYMRLLAGEYQIIVSTTSYELLITPIFSVGADERLDLGTLAITRIARGEAVNGRLVDAISGEPLRGFGEPFAGVYLTQCDDFGCFNFVGYQPTDDNGFFTFTPENTFNGLLAGTYVLSSFANGYQFGTSEPFTVGENAVVELGDVPVEPNPIRLTGMQGCYNLPSSGGTCDYQLDITNGQRQSVNYNVWSVVNSYSFATPVSSMFQPDPAKPVRLKPGERQTVTFSLQVPRTVPEGTLVCASVYVAEQGRGFYFQPLAQTNVFCAAKTSDGFLQLSSDEAVPMLQRINGMRESGLTRR